MWIKEVFLGTFVKTKRCGHRGVVVSKYTCLKDAGSSVDWFDAQSPFIPSAEKERPWVDILCEESGSVRVPLSDCEPVTPFFMINPLYEFYFGSGYFGGGKSKTIKRVVRKGRMLRPSVGGIA